MRGTYILERDRQKNRTLAPPWWNSFNFELYRKLEDTKDGSYFGAIYKFKSPKQYPPPSSSSNNNNNNHYEPPRYVIAFRGTLIRRKTFKRDFLIDLLIIFNEIHHSTRFKNAMEAVSGMIDEAAKEGITANMMWLVGHSLGASLALAVGKKMAKKNFHLETYLFNSPFSGIPLEIIIKNSAMKDLARFVKNGLTAGLFQLINHFRSTPQPSDEDVEDLSAGWIPHIFVNRDDFICAEYIGFFENREKMSRIGANTIAKLSTQHSLVSLISMICGRDPEPFYLLSSAYVTISPSSSGSPHQLEQWWSSNLDCEPEVLHHI